jgi:hypothetical protein
VALVGLLAHPRGRHHLVGYLRTWNPRMWPVFRAGREMVRSVVLMYLIIGAAVGGAWLFHLMLRELGLSTQRVVLALVCGAALVLTLYALRFSAVQWLSSLFGRGLVRVPRMTPDAWKGRLKGAMPGRQAFLLAYTSPETLGLNLADFVALLREVLPAVRQEPALSTYWSRRHQLEGILRQERGG